jgi:tetratricopeptide (TPR) repeat protein
MAIFYAESWALTHMLVLGSGYHDGFSRFVASVSAGNSAEASFASVYGKSLAQVRKDLDGYFQKTTVQVSLFNVKLEKINLQPAVAELAPLHTELALTDLLASQPSKAREAAIRLNKLAAEYPQNGEIEESLGYYAWQSSDSRSAAAHFAKAAEAGIDDPEMLFHYATLIGQDQEKLQTSIAAVKTALTLKPEYREAKYFLGMQEMNARQYGAAFSTLMSLKTIKPAEAFNVYSALAYCSLELKDPAQARKLGKQAQQYAGNDSERQRSNEFIDYLDRLEKYKEAAGSAESAPKMALPRELPQPAAMPRRPKRPRLTGQAVALECRDSLLRLHIQGDDKKLVFTIRDPKDIVVRNTKDGYVNFSCGPMKPVPVTVVFEADASGATAGLVRELDF